MRCLKRSPLTAVLISALIMLSPQLLVAQSEEQNVIEAASRYIVASHGSPSDWTLDLHRTGSPSIQESLANVTRSLGGQATPLEAVYSCKDRMDSATCELSNSLHMAFSPPEISGANASIKAYIWRSTANPRSPVVKESILLRLVKDSTGSWQVGR